MRACVEAATTVVIACGSAVRSSPSAMGCHCQLTDAKCWLPCKISRKELPARHSWLTDANCWCATKKAVGRRGGEDESRGRVGIFGVVFLLKNLESSADFFFLCVMMLPIHPTWLV